MVEWWAYIWLESLYLSGVRIPAWWVHIPQWLAGTSVSSGPTTSWGSTDTTHSMCVLYNDAPFTWARELPRCWASSGRSRRSARLPCTGITDTVIVNKLSHCSAPPPERHAYNQACCTWHDNTTYTSFPAQEKVHGRAVQCSCCYCSGLYIGKYPPLPGGGGNISRCYLGEKMLKGAEKKGGESKTKRKKEERKSK